VDVARQGRCHRGRPGFEQDLGGLVGQLRRAEEETGKRGDDDQERKQRHQGGQCDVAGDRPAVVRQKRIECVGGHIPDAA